MTATIAKEMYDTERWRPLSGVVLLGVLLFSITFIVNLTAHLVIHGVKRK